METKVEKFQVGDIIRLLKPIADEFPVDGVLTEECTSHPDHPIFEMTSVGGGFDKYHVTGDMIEKVPQEEWTAKQIRFRALTDIQSEGYRVHQLWEWLNRKKQEIGPLDIVKPMSGCGFIKHDLLTVEYIKNDRAHCLCGVKLQYKMSLPLEVLDIVHKYNPVPDKWDKSIVKMQLGRTHFDGSVMVTEKIDMSEAFKETLSEKIQPKVTV